MNAIINSPAMTHDPDGAALVRLLTLLDGHGYRFITPTPATHRRVLKRNADADARDLRDVFGWSLPFKPDLLPADVFEALKDAGGLRPAAGKYRAGYRVSSLGDDLFLHAAFPPSAQDAVFFGPDTYRFARFLRQEVAGHDFERVIDIGTGSGAGAVAVARAARVETLVLCDINPVALATARANLGAAGLKAQFRLGKGLDACSEPADLIIANPPFIAGSGDRTYRDGGGMIGAQLSLDWSMAAAAQLKPNGRFLLYTGSAIVRGADALREALAARLDPAEYRFRYGEIDPDIFGGQLGAPGYEAVERIAAVGAVIQRRG